MRKLLNTLYVTRENAYLALDDANVTILEDGEKLLSMPLVNLESIVCFSYQGCSPALMGACCARGISLDFITPYGKFLARVVGPTRGTAYLRRRQCAWDEKQCLSLAAGEVAAKVANCRTVLRRAFRDYGDAAVERAAETLKDNARAALETRSLDSLLGLEGESARVYFGVFGRLIRNSDFSFGGRSKRPPLDPVNCLLSYLYTLLTLRVTAALETVGLDPYIGFYHTDRSGRASLACDLTEELRFVVDRAVLRMINLKSISKEDFVARESGAVELTETGRKTLLKIWQQTQAETVTHDVIKERVEIGLLPYVQAQLLARYTRGDVDEYQPYLTE